VGSTNDIHNDIVYTALPSCALVVETGTAIAAFWDFLMEIVRIIAAAPTLMLLLIIRGQKTVMLFFPLKLLQRVKNPFKIAFW
jgi:hypothetical protein